MTRTSFVRSLTVWWVISDDSVGRRSPTWSRSRPDIYGKSTETCVIRKQRRKEKRSKQKISLQFRRLDGYVFGYLGQFRSRTTHHGADARTLWRTVVVAKTTLIVVTWDLSNEEINYLNFSFRARFFATRIAFAECPNEIRINCTRWAIRVKRSPVQTRRNTRILFFTRPRRNRAFFPRPNAKI